MYFRRILCIGATWRYVDTVAVMSLRRRTQVIAPAAAYWLHRVLDDLDRGGKVQGVAGAEPGLHLCRGYWWNLFVCV